jgi:Zn-dependent protease
VLAVVAGSLLDLLDAPIVSGAWLLPWSSRSPTAAVLLIVGQANVVLAVLNLLPVPPLDGAAMVERLLPRRWRRWWPGPVWAGPVVLVLLVLPVPGIAQGMFTGALHLWARLWW